MEETIKVYTDETIQDQPFPANSTVGNIAVTVSSGQNQVYKDSTIQDQTTPPPPIQREIITQSLNTKSKKILQEYQFADSGAIRVGKYTPGVSGEVDISPAGIVAKDQSGNTTIAIDGDTGDATFAGTLEAGTIIGGDGNVQIDRGTNGGGRILLLNNGIPSIIIGDPS